MNAARIVITLDRRLIRAIDLWVSEGRYASRSLAVRDVIRERIRRMSRLRRESAKCDPEEEKALAEERYAGETWPEW